MKTKSELANEIKKDVISVLISLIDEKTDEYYLNTTDCYLLENQCEWKAIAKGYKISILSNTYEVTQVNLEFISGGLTDTKTPQENTKGQFNPYSAILNVYVKKII